MSRPYYLDMEDGEGAAKVIGEIVRQLVKAGETQIVCVKEHSRWVVQGVKNKKWPDSIPRGTG